MFLTSTRDVVRRGGGASCLGTIANVNLKKGTKLHVGISADLIIPSSSSQNTTSQSIDRVAAKRRRDAYRQPLFVNLGLMPPKHTSLLQFLVLRHMWASQAFALVEQHDGCYAAVSSDFAPPLVLQTVMHRMEERQGPSNDAVFPSWLKPHSAERRLLLLLEDDDGAAFNEDVSTEGGSHINDSMIVGSGVASRSNKAMAPSKLLWDDVIPEDHLFSILDDFDFPLPPADDLANPEYWALFKGLWADYQRRPSMHANATIQVEDASKGSRDEIVSNEWPAMVAQVARRRLVVRILRDIPAGEPILVHRGRAWWAQRLLSQLFVAAEDDHLTSLRWIESLVAQQQAPEGSRAAGHFPLLKPCRVRTSKARRGEWALGDYNARRTATSSAITAFALRRSCQEPQFLQRLLTESFGWGNEGLPDGLDPLKTRPTRDAIGHVLLDDMLCKTEPHHQHAGGADVTTDSPASLDV